MSQDKGIVYSQIFLNLDNKYSPKTVYLFILFSSWLLNLYLYTEDSLYLKKVFEGQYTLNINLTMYNSSYYFCA